MPAALSLAPLIVAALAVVAVPASSSSFLPVGANIDGVADYSNTLPFVDVVKQSRTWGSYESPWDGNCSTDGSPAGWPSQSSFGNVFVTLMGDIGAPTTPSVAGNWSLIFEGQADVALRCPCSPGSTVADLTYDDATDTTTATVVMLEPTPNDCNCIMLGFANASTKAAGPGLRNIRLLQPGYTLADAGNFSTPLLTLLSRFTVLRFMDWAATNGNLIQDWSQRTQPESYSYAGSSVRQVPWEVIFSLANTLQKDVWINVPINATEDYVTQLAQLAKATLDASLNVFLELSNEVWNFSFEQTHVNFALANASVYAGDPYHFNATGLEGNGNPGYWMLYRYAWLSLRNAQIFASVFGPGSVGRGMRVRPVFAWQQGDGSAHELGLTYLLTQQGVVAPSDVFDSVAMAPYLTIGPAAEDPALTVDAVIAGWESYLANISLAGPFGNGSPNYVAGFAATCSFWGISCRCYESGPDTAQGINSGPPLWAKANASADPRVGPIVTDFLQLWASHGAQMSEANYFTAGAGPLDDQYGIYDILQRMDFMNSSKLQGIDEAIEGGPVPINPAIPSLASLPLTLNASYFAGHPNPPTPDGFDHWPAVLNYLVSSPSAQKVSVVVTASSDDKGPITLQLGLGYIGLRSPDVRNVTCTPSGPWGNSTACGQPQVFDVPAGVSTVRVVRPPQNAPWVGALIFSAAGGTLDEPVIGSGGSSSRH